MGRHRQPDDLITLSRASVRYGVSDSTLRHWIGKKELHSIGKRPSKVSESAVVALLTAKGKPHEPLDDVPVPEREDDRELSLAEVADVLGVKRQTASAYKSEASHPLKSYRRSDVLAYRDQRDSGKRYSQSGVAEHRARREAAQANIAERKDAQEAGLLYRAEEVDEAGTELGRLLATHRQQGAQRIAVAVQLVLGDHSIETTGTLRADLVSAVADVLDEQGRAVEAILETLAKTKG